ncbi:UDP-N-acetylmuramoyl-tripeptide--D-alanyl-D-alanine ligase [Salinisphaera hydrothermalis]|uniref:UDP-N-acetylmuramoyl-tripeptide--D-alanyl-D-alanine ligase n=1 Tax=Salinisphaera hydrothermalis (strain C41B8) TaxID=1304275 RepID=A0A084IP73_SALHC|nr:UDP-N-acetylmuramoyl-tripeptide--D-alanyl-D-alanine ligase [Salinisphaera hydrothermalis]KEZ78507.1 UDP-N-acetylmuramoyl-tripeptide--D-alanyl-D-alanine ligase [Salinisphaera hydrothermalis C41B8]
MKGRLSEFALALGACLIGDDAVFDGASIDTRRITPGALFFALAGEHADGHEFVAAAGAAGAAAAVVDHPVDADVSQLVVDDVMEALGRAARLARAGFAGPVVGVTGSNGKTTVKQMIAAIFSVAGPTMATEGNLNNHLGVPLTLMRLDASAERAVIEMGANHPGEIGQLAAIARPDVGVITNAGWAHLEGFGSREGIARAKGELFIRLPESGTAVINADDDYADLWRELAEGRRMLTFSMEPGRGADVYADDIELDHDGVRFALHTPGETTAVALDLAGRHNVANALAAAAVAVAVGLKGATIAAGLARTAAVAGRLAIKPAIHGARLVDDSYNANPGSLAAALSWLGQQSGARWAVLGDMGELGDYTESAHRDAGIAAREAGVERLFATGEHSRLTVSAFGDGGAWYPDHDSLTAALSEALGAATGDVIVLVKGSRSARMDRVADALRANSPTKVGASC